MISIFLIKTALLRFGVVIQDVKFDVDNEAVTVNFTKAGARQSKSVLFADIEKLFASDLRPPGDYDPRDVAHDPPEQPGQLI